MQSVSELDILSYVCNNSHSLSCYLSVSPFQFSSSTLSASSIIPSNTFLHLILFFFPFSVRPERVELVRRDYWANGGWETFLTYEDPQQDVLIGLLRLRK